MFVASQLLGFALEPLWWVLVLLVAGLLCLRRHPRLGRTLAWGALAALLVSGWTFLPGTMLRSLETRYPALPPEADLGSYAGVVVLGGALSRSELWTAHRQVALNEYAERMTVAVSLMRTQPHLKLLFTGGIASLRPSGLTEAQRAKIFFDAMGVDTSRVQYESGSRTTAENASLSAAMVAGDKSRRWLLLTSAFHMPRSMGVFQKAGWNVTAYPVDFHTDADPDWTDFSLHYGPELWQLALHEVVGYYAYRMAGAI